MFSYSFLEIRSILIIHEHTQELNQTVGKIAFLEAIFKETTFDWKN